MTDRPVVPGRFPCPCCGYPTLEQADAFCICRLCWWEDDGQAEQHVVGTGGSPDMTYTLAQARLNFRRYLVMFEPGHDPRVGGADSPIELDLKRRLIGALDRAAVVGRDRSAVLREIRTIESALQVENNRRVANSERPPTGST